MQKEEGSSLSPVFTPDIYVIFHVIWLINTNEEVMKNKSLQKFENNGVCFGQLMDKSVQDATVL